MMTAKTFTDTCRRIAEQYKTCYVWGGCGMPITEATIKDKLTQYPAENQNFCANARKLIGKHAWMFDCVCTIKAVLWGWRGDWNKYFGGAVYASNGVPDVSADGMIGLCKDVSSDFSKITVGEALWLPGHIGVYIGGGLAVECTPAFDNAMHDNGVKITSVGNIGTVSGYPVRKWQKHGKMPWVDYTGAQADEKKNGEIIVNGRTYPIDRILKDGRNYFQVRELIGLLNDNGTNVEIGNKGNVAVLTVKGGNRT